MSVVRVFFCAAIFLVGSAFGVLADNPKLALIITNKAYPASIGALENTHRDGERMAAALTALGFSVVHKRDLDKGAMLAEVSDYVDRLEKAGPEAVGFFYYAGHGAANSKRGDNYLIPVEAPIVSDRQLALQAVKLGEIIDSIAETSAKTNFLVFDACRNVPIGFSVRSALRGFRAEAHRQGMLIAFATDPGKTATDEGVYAEALSEEMQRPGVLATEVFRAVRNRVLAATKDRQGPWIEDGLSDNMYFKLPPVRWTNEDRDELNLPNDAGALFNLGVKYQTGDGVAQDKAKAARLYRKAADLGNTAAMNSLGVLYERGDGIAQDHAEAARLYRKAADLGDALGMSNLATRYELGHGVAQDKAEAARLYRKAADLGIAHGMFHLGRLYDSGQGVERDRVKAAELIVLALKKEDWVANQAAFFLGWSEGFRTELQRLLKAEGVYSGPVDGDASEALKKAVLALAAKSKGGG